MSSEKLEREITNQLHALSLDGRLRNKVCERIIELFRNVGQGRAGDRSSHLLSAQSERGTEIDFPVERMSAERAPSIACRARCRPEQGSAEEEERLFDLEQEFIAADLRYRAAIKEHVKCCSARNWSEEKSCENKFMLAAHAFARALRERPDETATGERGEVLSDEAMTFGEFYELYDLMYEEIAVLESESDSLDRDAVDVSAILKEYGWDVRRISGDGTSERRADNVKAQGMDADSERNNERNS